MKFNDYTRDIIGLGEAKISGDPKLYKKMEEIRKQLKNFKGSKDEKFVLGADLAKAMSDYLESTLNKKPLGEAVTPFDKAKYDAIKALKTIESTIKKSKKSLEIVMGEVFDDDSSDSIGAQLDTIIQFDASEIIEAIEDYE